MSFNFLFYFYRAQGIQKKYIYIFYSVLCLLGFTFTKLYHYIYIYNTETYTSNIQFSFLSLVVAPEVIHLHESVVTMATRNASLLAPPISNSCQLLTSPFSLQLKAFN